jgi:hypothetical protein
MNARCAPQPILNAHPPDQRPQIHVDSGRPSRLLHLGSDDRDGLQNRRKPAIQLDEEQPIAVGEIDATAYPALQNDQLLPERDVLGSLKVALGLTAQWKVVARQLC